MMITDVVRYLNCVSRKSRQPIRGFSEGKGRVGSLAVAIAITDFVYDT